jgi:DNA-directed RNA polymerase beta subunit
MERDALVAHGMSKFLAESMMERADKTTVQVDKEAGRIGTSRETLDMPYAMKLFTQELESAHVTMRLETTTRPVNIPQTSTRETAPTGQSDEGQAPQ